MQRYKLISKIYFSWQAEAEARWLQEMSREGLEFVEYVNTYYYFKVRETPIEYEFKFERKLFWLWQADKEETYINRMAQEGWEFINFYNLWYYFRKPVNSA